MPVREDIFWVTCPQCEEEFYCENELRHGTIKLMCPKCHHRFFASESQKIVE